MTSLETLAVRSRAFLDQGSSVSGVYVGCNKRKGPEVGKTLECWQKNMFGWVREREYQVKSEEQAGTHSEEFHFYSE
jgi:hypothetical protein